VGGTQTDRTKTPTFVGVFVLLDGAGEEIRTLDVHLASEPSEGNQQKTSATDDSGGVAGEGDPVAANPSWSKSVTEFGSMNSAGFVAVARRAADAALVAYLGVMALGIAGALGA
jgi:hypothetical protein